jgi:hypothetical protein
MKLSAYYKLRGHEVGFDINEPDNVYISVVFNKNRGQAAGIATMYPDAKVIIGGSGWDLQRELPEEIEYHFPDYDLYPSTYSQGFSTRGCIRKCPFCIVPKKEGAIREAQHPYEFHDDRFDTIMLMDNNLFGAGRDWVNEVFSWFIRNGIKMDMTQGFDIRLLNEEYAKLLAEVKHAKGIRFAWDNITDEEQIVKGIKLLEDVGINLKHDVSFYVLAGYNTTFDQDLYRCNRLRDLGCNSYVMQYHKKDPRLRKLAKWANRRWAYWSGPFVEANHGGKKIQV